MQTGREQKDEKRYTMQNITTGEKAENYFGFRLSGASPPPGKEQDGKDKYAAKDPRTRGLSKTKAERE